LGGSGAPCTTIPGLTQTDFYWSSSTYAPVPHDVWCVLFNDGGACADLKDDDGYARAVRSGS
jgi:hypothetical protein